MEAQEALKIVRALADGVHPETGEALQGDSVYQNPRIIRALNRAVAALVHADEWEQKQRRLPLNAGRTWSRAEDAQICDELKKGTDLKLIAKNHNRTVTSIVARLVRLGKIVAGAPTKVA